MFCFLDKANATVVSDKEKDQIVGARPSPARSKDQPTLHQFVTPVRKRKRNKEKGESPQTPQTSSPSALTPTVDTASTGTPKLMPGKGSPGMDFALKCMILYLATIKAFYPFDKTWHSIFIYLSNSNVE